MNELGRTSPRAAAPRPGAPFRDAATLAACGGCGEVVDVFFALLRAGLYGRELAAEEVLGDIDWEVVMALAQKHAVCGIIIESVRFLPEELRPPGPLAAKMNRFAMGLIQTNLILDKTAARLSAFLEQHGVKGVMLKGQGVARFYRLPQMRQSGDIDFYVGSANYRKAIELCSTRLADDEETLKKAEIHYSFSMSGVTIELHRLASRIYSPFRKKRFQEWIVDELEHSPARRKLAVGTSEVTLPSVDFDAIYIFYHAWLHYVTGGIGLRQLCDWAMIFHSRGDDIDKCKLTENIRRFGLEKGWKLFAGIAVDHLGVPPDRIPLYDPAYARRSEKVLAEILEGGNFGVFTKANLRTPAHGYGLWHGVGRLRNFTQYFISLFTLLPVEATFLYLHRLFHGTIFCLKNMNRGKKRGWRH